MEHLYPGARNPKSLPEQSRFGERKCETLPCACRACPYRSSIGAVAAAEGLEDRCEPSSLAMSIHNGTRERRNDESGILYLAACFTVL